MGVLQYMPEPIIYLSKCQGVPIYNSQGKRIGSATDFFVDYEEQYPTVLAVLYKQNKQFFYVKWEDIKIFSYKKIILREESEIRRGRTFPKIINKKAQRSLLHNQYTTDVIEYPPVGKMILDKQIIDTAGKKVVRVNDINLIKVGKNLRVTHAAVGLKSMLRRIGLNALVKIIEVSSQKSSLKYEKLISWRFVHAIGDRTVTKSVSLNVSNEDLRSFHPADLADILEELDGRGRDQLFEKLDTQLAAETLSEMDIDIQQNFLKEKDPKRLAELMENMGSDEAADILNEMNSEKQKEVISFIQDAEMKQDIQELLVYDEDEAGGLMSAEVFALSSDKTKTDVLDYIVEMHEELENINDIYIIDESETLLGICTLQHLLSQRSNISLSEIMDKENINSLPPEAGWKEVAIHMSKYNLMNVPITDKEQKLLGVVSVDDILPWLLDEK